MPISHFHPSSFIWEQYTHVLDSIPAANPLTREKIRWKIMHILPEVLHQPEFAALKYYLKEDDLGIKRFQLAEKIAEIFDQYLVYRPQWIVEWEAGNDLTAVSQPWILNGRPVMLSKNNYELELYNGDIGITMMDDAGGKKVFFEMSDKSIRAISPGRLNECETVLCHDDT